MLPDGDFVNMFSFTYDGLMDCFDTMYGRYDIAVTDPVAHWARRGLGDESLESPTHENLLELYEIMRRHASRYIETYYESDAELVGDGAVEAWLDELDELVPNGVRNGLGGGMTRQSLARLSFTDCRRATPVLPPKR